MSRHVFFGANTPNGFYQCFSDILFPDEAQKIIYLKGSSGCGKSTLMKKVSQLFEEKGSPVDYIHCSNNTADLDGICIRDYGISIIDATAPHVCDPAVPIALDEILNLADYIDREQVAGHAAELLQLNADKKPYYEKAYRYLNAACTIYENNRTIRSGLLHQGKLNQLIAREISDLNLKAAETPGRNRRMFASAVSPQGLTNYLDTMLEGYRIIQIAGEDGTGSEVLLAESQKAANAGGLDTETCYSPWNITKAEHLFIPALQLCYLTKHEFCPAYGKPIRMLDMNKLCDTAGLTRYEEELSSNKALFEALFHQSMEMMAAQKAVHDKVEEIYKPSMDFGGVDACTAALIERLKRVQPGSR